MRLGTLHMIHCVSTLFTGWIIFLHLNFCTSYIYAHINAHINNLQLSFQQKLPVCHKLSDGTYEPITVLEAVVRQTGIYAASRAGRLSVFWGDQIFVPTSPFEYTPTHHVDIMCTLEEDPPTEKVWKDKGLDKYGVIAVSGGKSGDAAQVEKVDHATAMRMLKNLGDIAQVGPSLGSFSVSASILEALCEEFKTELDAKDGKLDTGTFATFVAIYLLMQNACVPTYYLTYIYLQIHTFGCPLPFHRKSTFHSCPKREWKMMRVVHTMFV